MDTWLSFLVLGVVLTQAYGQSCSGTPGRRVQISDLDALAPGHQSWVIQDICYRTKYHARVNGHDYTGLNCPTGWCVPEDYAGGKGYKDANLINLSDYPCVPCTSAASVCNCLSALNPLQNTTGGGTLPDDVDGTFFCAFGLLNDCGMELLQPASATQSSYAWQLKTGFAHMFRSTGPGFDGRGDSNGYYLWTDSERTNTGNFADPEATLIRLPGVYSGEKVIHVSFKYHMLGADVRTLRVVIIPDDPSVGGKVVWEQIGNKGDSWLYAEAPIPSGMDWAGSYIITIEATRSPYSDLGDIAIDDILVRVGNEAYANYRDCGELKTIGNVVKGWYAFRSSGGIQTIFHCDPQNELTYVMERDSGFVAFNKSWDEYKVGFGDIMGDHWLGLEHLYLITNSNNDIYSLTVQLETFYGQEYQVYYDAFSVGPEAAGYPLYVHYDSAKGAGLDSLGDPVFSAGQMSHGVPFSTYDVDNQYPSGIHCASEYQSGWWFDQFCSRGNLAGMWSNSQFCQEGFFRCANWDQIGEGITLKRITAFMQRY